MSEASNAENDAPSNTLRRAAALMRERAEAATPGPWRPNCDKVRGTSADSLIEDNVLIAYAGAHPQRLGMKKTGRGTPVPEHAPDVQHVASWHPAVALAVADFLEYAADYAEKLRCQPPTVERAMAVAVAYLGDAA